MKNKNYLNSQSGFSPIMIVLFVIVLLLVASAAAFYILKAQGKLPGYGNDAIYNTVPESDLYASPLPVQEENVSNEDDINTLQMELESTNERSLESDFAELDSQSSSL